MPFRMEGWIEVSRRRDADQEDAAWRGVIRIPSIIDAPDEISERLFGLSKAHTSPPIPDSLAGGRGLPADPSPEVRADLERIEDFETQYGKGEFGGYTYALWREIAAFRARNAALRPDDWGLALDLMERIAADVRFPDDRIRIVVWYNW